MCLIIILMLLQICRILCVILVHLHVDVFHPCYSVEGGDGKILGSLCVFVCVAFRMVLCIFSIPCSRIHSHFCGSFDLKKQERKSFCFTLIKNLWSTNTMLHEGHFSFRIHQYFPFWAQLLLDCFMLLWCIGGIVVLSLNMLGHLSTSCLSTRFSPVAEDDPQVLDRPKCLAALASLRHAKWFQVRLICCFKRNCHILSYNVV